MLAVKSLLLAACTAAPALAEQYPQIPIFDAASFTTVLNKTANGELQLVSVPDPSGGGEPLQELRVLHLYGSPEEMGIAHGQLLGAFAADFVTNAIPKFFESGE